jgi:hypothetical protein
MQQIFTILPHENFLRTATKYHRSKSETTRSKSHENLLRIPFQKAKTNSKQKQKRFAHQQASTERAHTKGLHHSKL